MIAVSSALYCILSSNPLRAEEMDVDVAPAGIWSNLTVSTSVGYQQSYWNPGLFSKDKSTAKLVEYKTEGLQSYVFSGQVGYSGSPVLSLHYEMPVTDGSTQKEMIAVNKSQSSGLEKIVAGIQLNAAVKAFEADNKISKSAWLSRILSIRYRYIQEVFFLTSTALTGLNYIPLGSNKPIGVWRGDKLSTRTTFKDNELTLDVLADKESRYAFRMGYYDSVWDRPSDNTINSLPVGGLPTLYETSYKTRGAVFSFETRDTTTPGLGLDFFLRLGLSNGISNKIDPNLLLHKNEQLSYVATGGSIWYNKYWFGKCDTMTTCKGPFGLSVGGGVDFRHFAIRDTSSSSSSGTESNAAKPLDQDLLYKLVANALFNF